MGNLYVIETILYDTVLVVIGHYVFIKIHRPFTTQGVNPIVNSGL